MTKGLLDNLNEAQKLAVTHDKGPLLVLAGAGSGKTRVLTYRVAWLISQKKAMPENIALLTFTNKAAAEMKQRVAELTEYKPTYAGTFHSFCVQILRRDGEALGIPRDFLIYDQNDSADIIKDALVKLNLPEDTYNPKGVAAQISDAKNQMLTPLTYSEFANSEREQNIFKIWLAYEKALKENEALDFNDLIGKTVKLFEDNKEVLNKWQNMLTHVLVDEWQDTNKVQYTLAKYIIGNKRELTAVGDASQSIYSWRGADYKNINYLVRDYPDIKIINLEQNYRSTQTILTAANAVISKNKSHPILKLWTDKASGEKIKIVRLTSELDEASFMVNEIQNMTAAFNPHARDFSDVAILYRTNAQSRVIEESLLHAGIPYVLVGGTKFYDRAEIKDVLSYLRFIVKPKDSVSAKRAQKTGKRRFAALLELTETMSDDWQETLSTLDLLDSVIAKTNYLDKFKRESEENLARLENIKELRSVAAQFPNILDFLENVALVEAEETKNAARLQTPGALATGGQVTLMTLHAAKGLEFPVIFMAGMEEGIFPHSRSLFDSHQLEEERRLAYVGITRAKEILYLTFAGRRMFFGQRSNNAPSRFLIDIPEELSEGSHYTPPRDDYFDSGEVNF
jgi:DNA helicase-2/ATP-dependent DNA helicase PcrA